jgi:hypothetical protein
MERNMTSVLMAMAEAKRDLEAHVVLGKVTEAEFNLAVAKVLCVHPLSAEAQLEIIEELSHYVRRIPQGGN